MMLTNANASSNDHDANANSQCRPTLCKFYIRILRHFTGNGLGKQTTWDESGFRNSETMIGNLCQT
jgi:hypothetical protein